MVTDSLRNEVLSCALIELNKHSCVLNVKIVMCIHVVLLLWHSLWFLVCVFLLSKLQFFLLTSFWVSKQFALSIWSPPLVSLSLILMLLLSKTHLILGLGQLLGMLRAMWSLGFKVSWVVVDASNVASRLEWQCFFLE